MTIALTIMAIPLMSVAIGMAYAAKRGADYRPEYANIP